MWRQRALLHVVVAEFWGDERRRMSDPAISTSWQSALMKGVLSYVRLWLLRQNDIMRR